MALINHSPFLDHAEEVSPPTLRNARTGKGTKKRGSRWTTPSQKGRRRAHPGRGDGRAAGPAQTARNDLFATGRLQGLQQGKRQEKQPLLKNEKTTIKKKKST
jgi:hypothetical protein